MFASLRPRPEYEAELWRRLDSSPGWLAWWGRWARLPGSWPGAVRLAPVLAAVLIVIGGVAYLTSQRPPAGGERASSAAPSLSNSAAGFGNLPRPAWAVPSVADRAYAAPANPMLQPADGAAYTFTGRLPNLPATATVYRYDEPNAERRLALAGELGSRIGLPVEVAPTDLQKGVPPFFAAAGSLPLPRRGATPTEGAVDVLREHQLAPPFPARVVDGGARVVFARDFPLGIERALLVDSHGSPIGIQVAFTGQSPRISGPLELPLSEASYPLRSARTVSAALAGRSGAPAGGVLDQAQLVYVVAGDGAHGYLEPAILFTGPAGTVLVPAVAVAYLNP